MESDGLARTLASESFSHAHKGSIDKAGMRTREGRREMLTKVVEARGQDGSVPSECMYGPKLFNDLKL